MRKHGHHRYNCELCELVIVPTGKEWLSFSRTMDKACDHQPRDESGVKPIDWSKKW